MTRDEALANITARAASIGLQYSDSSHRPSYWLMTKAEYLAAEVCPRTPHSMGYDAETAAGDHAGFVSFAMLIKDPVPAEVLADYPDIDTMVAESKAFYASLPPYL